jgi:predicted PurR-regulated permease PerM
MGRIASLLVLAVLIVMIGTMTYQILATFLLPLFLAAMTAVLTAPLHRAITKQVGNRPRLAAALTTLVVFLLVLLPALGIGVLSVSETSNLLARLDRDALATKISTLQTRLSLGPPPPDVMRSLERLRRTIDALDEAARFDVGAAAGPRPDLTPLFEQLQTDSNLIEQRLGLGDPEDDDVAPVPAAAVPAATAPDAAPTGTAAPAAPEVPPSKELQDAWQVWRTKLAEPKPTPDEAESWAAAWAGARAALEQFRGDLLGGPIAAWFKQNVNLDTEQLEGILARLRSTAGPMALGTTQFLLNFFVQFTIGLLIMLVGVYYFLADGGDMADSIMRLTPLDRKYTQQLGDEFVNLTGAIVMSMLLAAVVQGILAGVGYWIFGIPAVFLLTILTTLFAMVPLVGATIVWGGCAVWLFFEGHTWAAVGLAVYGSVVVSLADNLIKPMILHGRSNLHPFAALLSVLGGAAALGPIGVFVGPMVVALLHTLLVMLQKELKNFDRTAKA